MSTFPSHYPFVSTFIRQQHTA
ncbi:uncharacterized protein FFNC_15712 [Fusarium fujikuroi]|nr:uncharacterized protein FFNC_15712 [Fusarium fujikuroi]